MGHDCAVAALTGIGLEDLARIGITTTGRTTTGDEALSEEQPHVAVRHGQLLFACADPRLVESVEAVAVQLGARMAGIVLGSTADFHLLHLRDGDRVRERLVHEGETVESSGEPWPEETALDEEQFTEDGMLAVFGRVTGVGLDDAWMNQEFHQLQWGFPGDEVSPGVVEVVETDEQETADDSRYVPVTPIATSYKLAGVALAVGLAFEALFGVLALSSDADFGPPVVHVLFAVLAAFTLFRGRMSIVSVLWTAAEAAVLLVAVVVTVVREAEDVVLLVAFAVHLVVLLGILGLHSVRLRSFERAFAGG
ncbi:MULTISPECIES: hypothetical protein [unclassified Nocardioides]|uniref:hypothetical protein n=1 Tax=unclassified Nocardioides TaxID=2615069 RepID=UPI0006FCCFF9|nr:MULTISPECIES: hypothetical protein [unclassified Nocardioides]KRA32469.1 hypothetical protein ASD81_12975 [Nocardioides sp. Root614]KRA89123.1 hypothetical protein ASD84_13240 [Nocardioides sp. Root682]